jgi:hypothetical protein
MSPSCGLLLEDLSCACHPHAASYWRAFVSSTGGLGAFLLTVYSVAGYPDSGYHISGYPVLSERLDENMHVFGYPVRSEKLDENMHVSGYHISGYPVLPEKLDENMHVSGYHITGYTTPSLDTPSLDTLSLDTKPVRAVRPAREVRPEHANRIAVLSSNAIKPVVTCERGQTRACKLHCCSVSKICHPTPQLLYLLLTTPPLHDIYC